MVTDVQGVERLRARDAQAFRSLIERLEQPITGYLHRLVGDRDLALDAWIYRIATNYGLRYLNLKRLKQFVRLESREDFDQSLAVAGPEDQAETRILVHQALNMLKPIDAAVLQLHYGDNFTYEEIAQVVNMSAEAVRKRVARSVEKFRKVYGEKMPSAKTNHAGAQRREPKRGDA